jgi:hypothetical protein
MRLIHNFNVRASKCFEKYKPNWPKSNLLNRAYAPQPNETFNADANIGHRFAILMANVGALRPYRASGAG